MSKGLFAIGLIMIGLGAFVASVEKSSDLPSAFLVVGVVITLGAALIARGGKSS